jgi:hypothetical protein
MELIREVQTGLHAYTRIISVQNMRRKNYELNDRKSEFIIPLIVYEDYKY